MASNDSGSQANEPVSTETDIAKADVAETGMAEASRGRQGRIESTRGRARQLAMVGGVIAVLVLGLVIWLLGFDDEAAREAARRRAVSALELQGVRLEPVRPDQLASDRPADKDATLVTLADEHLKGGVVDLDLLRQLGELGPLVVSLAQTDVTARGIGPGVSQPGVWGLSLLGTGIDDGSLAALEGRLQLRLLSLERTAVSDPGLAHLVQLTGLRHLYLTGTRVTNEGIDQISGLTRLESLKLGGTEIGDDGLVSLARLPRLKYLTLDRTRVTDAGIPVLAEIRSLEFLDLHGTWVTSDGIQTLRDALPECRIEY